MDLTDRKLLNSGTGGWQKHQPDGDFLSYGEDDFEVREAAIAQARDFAAWISGEISEFRGEAQHGYKALEMVLAVYESARTHTQVQMPLKTMASPLELMIDSGHLPVRYPGRFDIRNRTLRGENVVSDTENV